MNDVPGEVLMAVPMLMGMFPVVFYFSLLALSQFFGFAHSRSCFYGSSSLTLGLLIRVNAAILFAKRIGCPAIILILQRTKYKYLRRFIGLQVRLPGMRSKP